MSKARLVLNALFVDRQTPAEVSRRYGVHRSWVYRLRARHEAEGEAALQPRPRWPNTSSTAIPAATVELIIRVRKELARPVWPPDRTPSSGICASTAASPCHRRRSADIWPGPDLSARSRPSVPAPPTFGSPRICPTKLAVRLHPMGGPARWDGGPLVIGGWPLRFHRPWSCRVGAKPLAGVHSLESSRPSRSRM
jgi:Winged helix-turn helix